MIKIAGCFILLVSAVCLFPVDTIQLDSDKGINFLEKMEGHDYFFGRIREIDVAGNEFYFLDSKLKTILRLDNRTGKLINSISSPGQGPFQLHSPSGLRVRNNMVFVSDMGFSGIKIFQPDGKPVKEFKTATLVFSDPGLDVNVKNEIFLKCKDSKAYPAIFVYNMNGEKLRTFTSITLEERTRKSYFFNIQFTFKLDSEENVIVLFFLKKQIRKYDKNGKLLWEKELKNEIIDSYDTDPQWRFLENGTVHCKTFVHGMDIDPNDNIVVGHIGGAAVYDKAGELVRLIRSGANMHRFRFFNDRLLHVAAMGYSINIYDFVIKNENEVK